MPRKAMLFVAPSGATFALLHVAPLQGELLYSPDGKTLYELRFRSTSGFHGRNRVEVDYTFSNPFTAVREKLRHHNGVMTHDGTEYRIDQATRTLDTTAIVHCT